MSESYTCPHLPGTPTVTTLTCSARHALGLKLGRYSSDVVVDRYSACKTCTLGMKAHNTVRPDGAVSQETGTHMDRAGYVSKGSLNSARRVAQEVQAYTYNTVQKHPGITTAEFADLAGISKDAARARLRILSELGSVYSVERGMAGRRKLTPQWFITEITNG